MSNQLLGNLRDANPIPHPDRLLTDEADARAFLATVQERRHGMANKTQPEVQPTEAPPRPTEARPDSEAVISVVRGPRRRFVYGLAAAVAVLIVGTLTWIAFIDDGESPVAAPVDIGRSFIEAQDAWDAEAAIALFAPNKLATGFLTVVEEFPSYYAWLETLDWRYTAEECNQVAVGPPVEVTCSYSYENAWTQALGVGPYSGSSMRFFIADGQIQQLNNTFITNTGFSVQAWEVFTDWVSDTHPENLNVIIDLGIEGRTADVPIVTPEALVLWEQYTNEFVASVAP